ncbi:MAG: hypothetical protein JO250_15430 [Armatimonadetes bacterium]|nr:hypothetical protein [Armatimonadota bacterium]
MSEVPQSTGDPAEQENTQTVWPPAPRLPPSQQHRSKGRGWWFQWAFWVLMLIAVDVCHWIVRRKRLTVETVILSLIFAAVFGWFTSLSRDASGVGFLAWAAATVLALVVSIKISKAVHLSPSADAALMYADEYLPLLFAVGVVALWLQWKGRKEDE